MTRKHFEAVASILRENQAPVAVAQDFADYFEGQNPNFDRDRFLTACGVR